MTRRDVTARLQAVLDTWSRDGHMFSDVKIEDIDLLESVLDDEAEAIADLVMEES